jgi:hypothetical protein
VMDERLQFVASWRAAAFTRGRSTRRTRIDLLMARCQSRSARPPNPTSLRGGMYGKPPTYGLLTVVADARLTRSELGWPNPVHRESGRRFGRTDRRVPCGLAATPL